MNKIILLCFLALCISPALSEIWTSCGTASDDYTIGNVVITPDPPSKGHNLTVKFDGTLKTTVTGGNILLNVKYSIVTLINKNFDLCTEVESQAKCPFPAGPWGLTVSELIPGDAPGGSYTGTATLTDQNKKEIACIKFGVKL